VVKYLVSKGANVNARGVLGETPLLAAVSAVVSRASEEHLIVEIVKYLISKGANPKVRDEEGKTILHRAAEEGNLELVKYLVSKGFDVSARDKNGYTPLFSAAERSLKVLKYLVSKGGDINVRNKYGLSLLHGAAAALNLEVVKYLISKGLDVNAKDKYYGATPLHMALAMSDKEHVVNLRKFAGKIVREEDIRRKRFEVVKYLVSKGARVDERAIRYAKELGDTEIVRYLESFLKKK
jgi:ankyrin repeat protein